MESMEVVLMVIGALQVQLMAELGQAPIMGVVAAPTMGDLVVLSMIGTMVHHMEDLGARAMTDAEATRRCAGEEPEI